MKLEFKYKSKAEDEDVNVAYMILSFITIVIYGVIIGILLDNDFLVFALSFGVFFVIVFLIEPLAKIRIRILK